MLLPRQLATLPLALCPSCGEQGEVAARERSAAAPVYRDVAAARGLAPDLDRAEDGVWFMPDSMAGGVALADVDGDGDLDALLAHGRWRGGAPAADGLARLWLQGPDGRFSDVSPGAGVVGPHYGMGLAVGDVDNDGDVDVYVSCFGPDVLLRNRGDGTFEDVSEAAGVRTATGTRAWGASCTFADVDADGWLDLYVANYVAFPPGEVALDRRGAPEYPSPLNYPGLPDVLLANRGDGTFADVSVSSGVAGRPGRGLGVAAADLDGDGRLDFYVANDGEANQAWLQRAAGPPGAWRFEERALELGLALSGDGRPEASMGVARGDVDRDGHEDLYVTHLVNETHTLYESDRERGGYADRTTRAGLAAPTVELTGFGVACADLDLDGDLDLVAVHGRVLRGPERAAAREAPRWRPYAEPGLVLASRGGDGVLPRFDVAEGGELTANVETGRGLAMGDVDGDGDLDLLVATAAGAVRLYERAGAPLPARWIGLRAVDPALGGRDALGAVVALDGGPRPPRRTVQTAHGYLSASEPVTRFGFGAGDGDEDAPCAVTVTWPDGAGERFEGLARGAVHVLARGTGAGR